MGIVFFAGLRSPMQDTRWLLLLCTSRLGFALIAERFSLASRGLAISLASLRFLWQHKPARSVDYLPAL
jgi:hypothetical protein